MTPPPHFLSLLNIATFAMSEACLLSFASLFCLQVAPNFGLICSWKIAAFGTSEAGCCTRSPESFFGSTSKVAAMHATHCLQSHGQRSRKIQNTNHKNTNIQKYWNQKYKNTTIKNKKNTKNTKIQKIQKYVRTFEHGYINTYL